MRETKALEGQLHSWRPRGPSAALEGRLFAGRVRRRPQMALLVGWLAPAAACALLTFSAVNSGENVSGGTSRPAPVAGAPPGGQTHPGFVVGGLQRGQNELSSVTFDWTNRGGCTSSMFSLPRSRVN